MSPACFVPWVRNDDPRLALVCFPWAGAGAAPFRDWSGSLPEAVDLWALRLPGRESRLRERPVSGLDEAIAVMLADLAAVPPVPMTFFGHCSGALLAFELIREMRRAGMPLPVHLMVASFEAPGRLSSPRGIGGFREELAALGATPEEIMASERVMRLLRPTIESDLRIGRSYVYKTEEALDLPITVFATTSDYAANSAEFLDWRMETSDKVEVSQLAGINLYPGGAWDELGRRVQAILAEKLP